MIDDPIPWKDELGRIADRLEAKTKQTRWSERTGLLIERDFVLAAHAIRKLVGSHQSPEGLSRQAFPVRRYERTGPVALTADDIADSYDLENGRRKMLSVVELCDEITSSSVFAFCCGETADLFDGIYVSSDRGADEYVYLVLASDFIALCSDVGRLSP